jgi:hypothetical protein
MLRASGLCGKGFRYLNFVRVTSSEKTIIMKCDEIATVRIQQAKEATRSNDTIAIVHHDNFGITGFETQQMYGHAAKNI